MKKYVTEFIGTFFLVFTIGMCVVDPGAGGLAPLAIGAALMVMVYAGGHVSGAHYNPAVTVSVWLRGRCPTVDVVPYFIAQIAGSGLASAATLYLKGYPIHTAGDLNMWPALLAEFIGTFALTYVVLNVATAKATASNSYYGAAIGFTVAAMAFSVGGVSGGAFNPAVAVGITLMHLAKAGNIWIYLIAEIAAGVLAAVTFRAVNPDDLTPPLKVEAPPEKKQRR